MDKTTQTIEQYVAAAITCVYAAAVVVYFIGLATDVALWAGMDFNSLSQP